MRSHRICLPRASVRIWCLSTIRHPPMISRSSTVMSWRSYSTSTARWWRCVAKSSRWRRGSTPTAARLDGARGPQRDGSDGSALPPTSATGWRNWRRCECCTKTRTTTTGAPRSPPAKATASDCGEHSMAFLEESRVMTLVYTNGWWLRHLF